MGWSTSSNNAETQAMTIFIDFGIGATLVGMTFGVALCVWAGSKYRDDKLSDGGSEHGA
jgi:F0F1-type ATP synthase assembly protein I